MEEKGEVKGTLRERREQRRKNVGCANCQAKLDPPGFAFANYNASGKFRLKDGDGAIDASGVLPGGQSFKGPKELKQIKYYAGKKEWHTPTRSASAGPALALRVGVRNFPAGVIRVVTDSAPPPGRILTGTALVATVGFGVPGAVNAGLFAARILATSDAALRDLLTTKPYPVS